MLLISGGDQNIPGFANQENVAGLPILKKILYKDEKAH